MEIHSMKLIIYWQKLNNFIFMFFINCFSTSWETIWHYTKRNIFQNNSEHFALIEDFLYLEFLRSLEFLLKHILSAKVEWIQPSLVQRLLKKKNLQKKPWDFIYYLQKSFRKPRDFYLTPTNVYLQNWIFCLKKWKTCNACDRYFFLTLQTWTPTI